MGHYEDPMRRSHCQRGQEPVRPGLLRFASVVGDPVRVTRTSARRMGVPSAVGMEQFERLRENCLGPDVGYGDGRQWTASYRGRHAA